jgi:hypothetical protein
MNVYWVVFEDAVRMILKAIPQPEIDHIILTVLAQAGVLVAVEKHISGGNLPVVSDLVFGKNLRGRSLIPACASHADKFRDRQAKTELVIRICSSRGKMIWSF